jgi:(p)ppGpp synthase/HD superfamily hydrolase
MPHKLNQPLTSKFDEALQLASHLHREQARKGTQIPYISHLLSVSAFVLEYGGTEAQAIAALLHDAVEDCGGKPTLVKIEAQFGQEVAAIVEACTDSFEEGPKRGSKERKEEYLQHLRDCDSASLIVVAADKLHNLTAIQRDLRLEGATLWSRFNAGPDDQLWYYQSVIKILKKRIDNPIVSNLKETFEKVRRQIMRQRQ